MIAAAAPGWCIAIELVPRWHVMVVAAPRWCTAAQLAPHQHVIVTAEPRWRTATKLPCDCRGGTTVEHYRGKKLGGEAVARGGS